MPLVVTMLMSALIASVVEAVFIAACSDGGGKLFLPAVGYFWFFSIIPAAVTVAILSLLSAILEVRNVRMKVLLEIILITLIMQAIIWLLIIFNIVNDLPDQNYIDT